MAGKLNPPFDDVITSTEQLRTLYREPAKYVANKKVDHVEPWARAVIEASRFAFIATADQQGNATVSPKGGTDGFVTVLDPQRLAIPDYPGNNLLDGLNNIVENPSVGLIFLIPGRTETLRVDGDAWITTEPAVLDACAREGRRKPKTAIGVRVSTVFFHCPASFERSGLWKSEGWRDDASLEFDDFIQRGATS